MTAALKESAALRLTRADVLARLDAGAAEEADWQTVSRLLLERFSCRAFRPDPVPRRAIAEILETAQFTANWCNAQAWQVIVTEGEGTERFREALYARAHEPGAGSEPDIAFPSAYDGAHGVRQREAGGALYQSLGIERGDKAGSLRQLNENYRLFGAPHAMIVTTEAALGTYGAIDCGIYLANLMLLMQSRGISSIAQGALPRFSPMIRAHFGIPDNRQILCGLSFGYADEGHPANSFRTTRDPLEAAVTWVGD